MNGFYEVSYKNPWEKGFFNMDFSVYSQDIYVLKVLGR